MTNKRSFKLFGTRAEDPQSGVFEAYVSVYDAVDSYNTRFKYGCFAESLQARTPSVVWAHNQERPIGKVLEIREVPPGDASLPEDIKPFGGLYVKAALALKTRDGADAYEHLLFGSINEFSFGFDATPDAFTSNADGTTDINKATILELSPVAIAAQPLAKLIDVRSLTLDDKAEAAESLLQELVNNIRIHKELKERKGAAISKKRKESLKALAESLKIAAKEILQMLADAEGEGRSSDVDKLRKLNETRILLTKTIMELT